jgi:hypothetical protein
MTADGCFRAHSVVLKLSAPYPLGVITSVGEKEREGN